MIRCATTPTERAIRTSLALVTVSVAVTSWSTNLWCAIPAAVCAGFLAFGAITGWCPTALLQRASAEPADVSAIPVAIQPELNPRR